MTRRFPHIRADAQRYWRQGIPEAIYCPGKTPEQIKTMCRELRGGRGPVILTKIQPMVAKTILGQFKGSRHHPDAKLVVIPALSHRGSPPGARGQRKGKLAVSVISAGTSDVPVAEEAALTAESLGSEVRRFYDVGVAGLHRLLQFKNKIQGSCCVVVAAGMEGALPSVVGGLASCPVIALPTSVGYGTGLGGVAALLTMLNSCAPNVCTVNIDDGFGAGVISNLIYHAQNK